MPRHWLFLNREMGSRSKDLLWFEHMTSSISPIESALLVCSKKDSLSESHKFDPSEKPIITPIPKTQVLSKVKDFLGVMAEANKMLELDAKDLMLGVADLHTPEALAAAESAIAGNEPAITLAGYCDTESDDSDYNEESNNDGNDDDNKTSSPRELEKSNTGKDYTLIEATRKNRSKKRSRIVELS
ncbi:hypothetical protein REPUB_Repub01dG0250200 [Reevesia pubescens]